MTAITKPMNLANIANKFGISTKALASLYRQSANTTLQPAYNTYPGVVPFVARDSAGNGLPTSGAIDMLDFENCNYVVGCCRVRASTASYATSAEVIATVSVTNRYGYMNYNGTNPVNIGSAYAASSGATLYPETVQYAVGTGTEYKFYRWRFVAPTGTNYRFKVVAHTALSLNGTTSHDGWVAQNTTTYSNGSVSGGYNYIVVYARNR